MLTINQTLQQTKWIISKLIEIGLSSDQNFPYRDKNIITFSGANYYSIALRTNKSYQEIYDGLKMNRAFLIQMVDGALIQMEYEFQKHQLTRHRLAFFSSPYLEEFQNNPDVYYEDEMYADVIQKNIVSFPIRFDFDISDDLHEPLSHPKSHLTLGQYQNCRIPVTAPLTPYHFIDFILRNFYHTAFRSKKKTFAALIPAAKGMFPESITEEERGVVHIQVPNAK